ncbi:MAG: ATP-binding cassette domain-containing protein [Candidatus Absconditabacteria bacterium]|nr:ATP-binding cassette domain-containing protein [Candidatus Absconditabacteria bacterium]
MHIDNLIEMRNLTRGYPESPILLFNHYNFSLKKGEFCVIMGKSGTGKSTLARIITGEKKVGEKMIYHKHEDISKYTDEEMQTYRRKIGIIFQDYKLIEYMTVKENIIYPLVLYGVGDSIIEAKYKKLQQKYDITHLENLSVKFLSAGEKQKVSFARALIHEPEFIIADEPTGNLDREHTQTIGDLLIKSNQNGNTVLLITHDIHLVNYLKEKHQIRLEILG